MSSGTTKRRCAIYTRKSSEEGLEQDFNSLHAQREACESYIKSQQHEGWQAIRTVYDDGGYSGGNVERPALQALLQDIRAGRIDVVVVYKIDRLTRSLLDFAKIVETFDAHAVSFVSITQSFNTTTSMGRLTLNVLLSFAQFEREVTSERIRDKIAASKKKGMWMGGFVPMGYEVKERKLLIVEKSADTVRHIYRQYLELGCVRLLQQYLITNGVRSVRGHIISRGTLYKMLANPIYIGQIQHKGICHPGQHEPILDQELWDRVQQQMASNRIGTQTRVRKTEPCPLTNKLFDASGERLVPVHALKNGRRYRYYISQSLDKTTRATAPDGWRLPGQEIEQVIAHAAMQILHDADAITTALRDADIASYHLPAAIQAAQALPSDATGVIDPYVQRVELRPDGITLTLSLDPLVPTHAIPITLTRSVAMQMKRRGVEMRWVVGSDTNPVRTDATLITAVARAHAWFQQLATGKAPNIAAIAARDGVDRAYVTRVTNLAFLAPDIVDAIVAGKHPVELSVEKLTKQIDLPIDWSQQRQMLGF